MTLYRTVAVVVDFDAHLSKNSYSETKGEIARSPSLRRVRRLSSIASRAVPSETRAPPKTIVRGVVEIPPTSSSVLLCCPARAAPPPPATFETPRRAVRPCYRSNSGESPEVSPRNLPSHRGTSVEDNTFACNGHLRPAVSSLGRDLPDLENRYRHSRLLTAGSGASDPSRGRSTHVRTIAQRLPQCSANWRSTTSAASGDAAHACLRSSAASQLACATRRSTVGAAPFAA